MMTQTLHHPVTRLLTILPAACLMTLAILFVMHLLVHKDFAEIIEAPEAPRIMTFINEDSGAIKTIFDSLIKPVKPLPPEATPDLPTADPIEINIDPSNLGLRVTEKPVIGHGVAISADNQVMPVIKVQPNYPSIATMKGIEGYVDVVFDVTATGATENIRIVNAVPSSIFNRSVIQALKRWKYKPKTVDGVALKSFDVHERITFELEKEV